MQVTCAVKNSHFSSLYKGLETLSKTHFPFDKSQPFPRTSIPLDESVLLKGCRKIDWVCWASSLPKSWTRPGHLRVILAIKVMSLVYNPRPKRERKISEIIREEVLHIPLSTFLCIMEIYGMLYFLSAVGFTWQHMSKLLY